MLTYKEYRITHTSKKMFKKKYEWMNTKNEDKTKPI